MMAYITDTYAFDLNEFTYRSTRLKYFVNGKLRSIICAHVQYIMGLGSYLLGDKLQPVITIVIPDCSEALDSCNKKACGVSICLLAGWVYHDAEIFSGV